jgi:hypothetical protein
MSKRLAIFGVSLSFTVFLAACGSGSGSNPGTGGGGL